MAVAIYNNFTIDQLAPKEGLHEFSLTGIQRSNTYGADALPASILAE